MSCGCIGVMRGSESVAPHRSADQAVLDNVGGVPISCGAKRLRSTVAAGVDSATQGAAWLLSIQRSLDTHVLGGLSVITSKSCEIAGSA
jgi:hypothetical protein